VPKMIIRRPFREFALTVIGDNHNSAGDN
jgi:hypothetical protein